VLVVRDVLLLGRVVVAHRFSLVSLMKASPARGSTDAVDEKHYSKNHPLCPEGDGDIFLNIPYFSQIIVSSKPSGEQQTQESYL
jgi:hypothetical protein